MLRELFTRRGLVLSATVAALWGVAGCTVKKQETPPLAGPSEFGLSLNLTATPDVLVKDGRQQSVVVITARNPNNQAVVGLAVKVETLVNEVLVDYGRLSTKTVTTGSDGRASVTYTAPAGPVSGNTEQNDEIVKVRAIPISTDFSTAVQRHVEIRLMPEGQILPPNGVPVADFRFSPSSPIEGQEVLFDGSPSRDDGTITAFDWDFGDGSRGSGVQVRHGYKLKGSYTVTLSVTDDRGSRSSKSQVITVSESPAPKADFSFAPTNPEVGQSVFFNASLSSASSGRTLVAFDWTFGDGGSDSGQTVTHRFGTFGKYAVTLTVTDDLGKTGSIAKEITLGLDQLPTAAFVISPTDPTTATTVNFDGRTSTAPPGRTLVEWSWNFGDGRTASGERVSNRYSAAGTYVVTLSVTDSSGARSSATATVTVK